jgi:hypothetical protein
VLQRANSIVPLLAHVPLDLSDPHFAEGRFDVAVAVDGDGTFDLFDGSRIVSADGVVTCEAPQPRGWLITTPDGRGLGDGHGAEFALRR